MTGITLASLGEDIRMRCGRVDGSGLDAPPSSASFAYAFDLFIDLRVL
jgi:hypothetical protein